MKTAYLINDWQTWEALCWQAPPERSSVIYTESPYLFEKLEKADWDVRSLSEIVPQGEITACGAIPVPLERSWEKIVDAAYRSLTGIAMGDALGRSLMHLLHSALCRALQLRQVIANHDKVVAPYLDKEPANHWAAVLKKTSSFHCNYFGILAETGAFPSVERVPLGFSLAEVTAKFSVPREALGFKKKVILNGLRLMGENNQILPKLFFKALGRLPSFAGKNARAAYLINVSNFIFDVLPELAAKGWWFKKFVLPKPDESERAFREPIPEVETDLLAAFETQFGDVKPAETVRAAISVAARRVSLNLKSHLVPHALRTREKFRAWSEAHPEPGKILVTNGLFDSDEIVLAKTAEAHGVPVIAFGHGGIGLIRADSETHVFSDKTACSAFVAHNAYEVEYYRKIRPDVTVPIHIRGVGKALGGFRPKPARFLARKLLGVPADQKLVIYAPTRFREDHLWLRYEYKDVPYWHLIKSLVCDVFAKVPAHFFIKLHQKGLLPGQKKLYELRRHPLEILDLPKNVSFGTYPQLNYVRWGADVLIVDRATSTIQCALAANIPLIYLDHPDVGLEPEVRGLMADCVFLVNVAASDWKENLSEILGRPRDQIRADWKQKSDARRGFLEHYVLGPERSEPLPI